MFFLFGHWHRLYFKCLIYLFVFSYRRLLLPFHNQQILIRIKNHWFFVEPHRRCIFPVTPLFSAQTRRTCPWAGYARAGKKEHLPDRTGDLRCRYRKRIEPDLQAIQVPLPILPDAILLRPLSFSEVHSLKIERTREWTVTKYWRCTFVSIVFGGCFGSRSLNRGRCL